MGRGEHIINTGEVKKTLGGLGGNNTSSTGSGNETNTDGTALASDLASNGVRTLNHSTPASKTNVALLVSNNDVSLEAGTLSGTSLLLDGSDLHDLILEGSSEEVVHDLMLLDGESEKEGLLKRLDLSVTNETAELGHGDPLTLSVASAATTTTSTTSTSSTSESSTESTTALAASSRCVSSWCSRHY